MTSTPASQHKYSITERETAKLMCTVADANPDTNITWTWFERASPDTVLHRGPNYIITNITRERSGFYSCTARNIIGTSEAATIQVDVQCNTHELKYSEVIKMIWVTNGLTSWSLIACLDVCVIIYLFTIINLNLFSYKFVI